MTNDLPFLHLNIAINQKYDTSNSHIGNNTFEERKNKQNKTEKIPERKQSHLIKR